MRGYFNICVIVATAALTAGDASAERIRLSPRPAFRHPRVVAVPGPTDRPASPRAPYQPPVDLRPYPYGWFGVSPRGHASRHFGYYRQFTQWSVR